MPNDQQGVNLPVPPKSFNGNAHDGGPKNPNGNLTVFRFSNETKSTAKADRVIEGLTS